MDLLNAGLCLTVLNSQSIKFIFNYPMINLSRSVVAYAVSTLYSYVPASRPDCTSTTCRYVHIDEKKLYLKKLVMDSLFVQKEYSQTVIG